MNITSKTESYRTYFPDPEQHVHYGFRFRLHKSTNDYQEAMKLVDKQYLKIIEVHPPIYKSISDMYDIYVLYRHLTQLTTKRSWS